MRTKNYNPVFYSCMQCKNTFRTCELEQHQLQKHQFIYPKSPKLFGNCLQCDKQIRGYSKNKFCNQTCAASHNNKHSKPGRKYGPARSYGPNGESNKEMQQIRASKKRWTYNIDGPYSKLYTNMCKHCGDISLGRYARKYCSDHANLYSHKQRGLYWFSFNLADYPDLFDFSLLKQYGMRSDTNPSGVVRDHRVSVADAIKYQYDAYYIRHPINCQLMLSLDNARKYTNSSITYSELVQQVDRWDNKNSSQQLVSSYRS